MIATFLRAVKEMSTRQVQAETGVPSRVVARLRTGQRSDVQPSTLEKMRAHLAAARAAA